MKKNLRNRIRRPIVAFIARIRRFRVVPMTILVLAMLMAGACKDGDTSHEHDSYTCPMHPTVISDRPGACPVCGMDLVRKARAGEEVEITEDLARLLKSPSETVVATVKTIRGEYKEGSVSIQARGVVTYDTRNIYTVPARVGGRLEKFAVKYPLQLVSRGQKVAEIYSPEMVTAQRELLYLTANDPGNESLIKGARQRLSLLGATQTQIESIVRNGKAEYTFGVYSPYEGFVLADGQQTPAAPVASAPASGAGGMDGMSGGGATTMESPARSPSVAAADITLREGDYVNPGQTLFRIVNPSSLRVELNLPGSVSRRVAKGATVSLDFGDGEARSATVDFVQPFFNEGEAFLKVRVYTNTREGLTVGQLVTATIDAVAVEGLWIPKEAVLDLGTDRIVFVKEKNVFRPKVITTGAESNGAVQVNGLASSEEIAANAQYMVDSESFIRIDR